MRTSRRDRRRSRPTLEGLEDRRLLNARTKLFNGTEINDQDLQRLITQLSNTYPGDGRVPVSDRRIVYQTPTGQTAVVTLYGKGSLKGTTTTNGVLNLVYDLTDNTSRIVASVHGGGIAPLASIRDADTPAHSPSSTGADAIAAVVMPRFALVNGGYINLTGGVLQLNLYSLGRHTEVHLVQGTAPAVTTTNPNQIFNTAANFGQFTLGQAVSSATTGNTPTPITGTTGGFTTAGGGIVQVGGAGGLTGAGGGTVGNVSALPFGSSGPVTVPQPPAGVDFKVTRVDAGPLPTPPLDNPQVFAIDPTADLLIRYNALTGAPTTAIPLPTLSSAQPALGLATADGRQVVLVGDNQTVYAFDSVTGASAGSFTTAGTEVQTAGLTAVDGIGANATMTVLVQAGTPGIAVGIDLSKSLATGKAVLKGGAYKPDRELSLSGGATGAPGSDTIYLSVAGHFDPAQPNLNQFGMVALSVNDTGLREIDRAPLPANASGGFINAGPTGALLPDPSTGLGSLEGALARITGVNSKGQNIVTLYNPTNSLAIVGSVTLDSPNRLDGLTESFYPELRNAALVDVQGTLKRFAAEGVRGLVINGRSTVNLVAAGATIDTAIIGRPLDHVALSRRQNVQLISTARGANGRIKRGGVDLRFLPPSIGPVALP